jgi:hypothetical protein
MGMGMAVGMGIGISSFIGATMRQFSNPQISYLLHVHLRTRTDAHGQPLLAAIQGKLQNRSRVAEHAHRPVEHHPVLRTGAGTYVQHLRNQMQNILDLRRGQPDAKYLD